VAQGQARGVAASFSSEQPVHQRALPEVTGRASHHLQHEPWRVSLGQLGYGELLLELKIERVHRKVYRTRAQVRADIFDFIEVFYNPKWRHPTLG